MASNQKKRRSWPAGLRVVFRPNAASLALYSSSPAPGSLGTVTPVRVGNKSVTNVHGPGGGLVYVKWDNSGVMGVSRLDVQVVKGKRDQNRKRAVGENPKGKEFLWKWHKIVGMWRIEREVTPETRDQWLGIFRKTEPNESFALGARAPSKKPDGSPLPKLSKRGRAVSENPKGKQDAEQLSTASAAAEFLRGKLVSMFPSHTVDVSSQRGVDISVSRLSEDDYVKAQISSGYTEPPNLMVKIGIAPPRYGSSAWKELSVYPVSENEELEAAGITAIRRSHNLTPEKAVSMVLKWFEKNAAALGGTKPNPVDPKEDRKRHLPVIPFSDEWLACRAKRNPAIEIERNDPSGMRAIMKRAMAKRNPSEGDLKPAAALAMAVAQIGFDADAIGKNVSSLDPIEYFDSFLEQSNDPDIAMAALEDMASWGVTDKI